jgi:hypothetical protein
MVSAMTHPPIAIGTLRSKRPLYALTFDLHQKNGTIAFSCLVVPPHDVMHINALAARYWKCRPNIRLAGARHATPPHIAFSKH